MAYLQREYLCVSNITGNVRPGGPAHYPLHRLIYEEAYGIVLPKDWVVHHKNGDTLDNRAENLEAMPRSEHPSHHRRSVREDERRCGACGQWKPDSEFHRGQKRCKPCARASRLEWAKKNPDRVAVYQERARARYANRVAPRCQP